MRERRKVDLGVMTHALLRGASYIHRQQIVGEAFMDYEQNLGKIKKKKKLQMEHVFCFPQYIYIK